MKLIVSIIMAVVSFGVLAEDITSRDVREAIRSDNMELIKELTSDDKRLQSIFSNANLGVAELAVYFNKEEILTHVLFEYDLLKKEEIDKAIILACATNKQFKSAITQLIAKGGDINVLARGTSCLYTAVIAGDSEFYKFLISMGANPDQVVTPHPELGFPESVSIREMIDLRIQTYQSMKDA